MRTKTRTFLIIAILIFGYFLIMVKGWQPVAFVGWRPILKATLDEETGAYQRAFDVGSSVLPELQSKQPAGGKIRVEPKKILEKLIREDLVKIGTASLRANDLQSEVSREIAGSLGQGSQSKLETSLKVLYNWDIGEFQKFYLEPKALKEAVAKNLQDSGRTFSAWLADLAKNTKVIILIPGYRWDGNSGQVL